MPDINDQYEGYLRKHTAKISAKIKRRYEEAISQVMLSVNKITYSGQVFSVGDYPHLQQKIDSELKKMHSSIYSTIVNGIEGAWELSNKKNDFIIDRRIGKKRPGKGIRTTLFDPNKAALSQFIYRKEKGMNLSDRVWKSIQPFRGELEAGIGVGITDGKSAERMAKDANKYLLNPDALYRRVRDKKGQLKLLQPAKSFHPGQGVYRSSFKNAHRLTRTENNMAYRTADHERWKNQPFVLGFEVRLSKSHPRYDICDNLQGRYPRDFLFKGWHPQCLCHAVPILMGDEEYDKLENAILGIEDFEPNSANLVTQPPAGFTKYVRENKKRIDGWENEPYWVKDNREYYDKAANSKRPKPELVPAGRSIADQFTNKEHAIRKKAETALVEIDKVHGDGELKNIPIRKMSSVSTHGSFASTWAGAPVEIKLSTRATDPEFTMVHEMGHYLDLHALGKPGRFESEIAGSSVNKVIQKAKGTDLAKALQKILDDGAIVFGGKRIKASSALIKHVQYLLDPKELWARAYSQFVAKRSQSGVLLKGVQSRIARAESTGVLTQWLDADFADLEQAIEDLMIEVGWMVNR